MGCGTSFVKYVLFFFNLLFALIGLAMVGVGVAVLLKWTVLKDLLDNHLNVAPWLFIVIGAVVFIIAFFGCCGAIRESHCMIVTYAIFLLVIIIIQVVIAVLLFTYSDSIKTSLGQSVSKMFENSKGDKAAAAIFNNIEEQLECCGNQGPNDYASISNLGGLLSLPVSCCSGHPASCQLTEANLTGCSAKVRDLYEKWNKPIAGAAIGIACVEVVGALFALCLANSIRNMDRRSRY